MRWKLAALLLMTTCAYGQGVRFDSNVFTSATNVSNGAQSTVFTVPYAHITVCAYPATGAPCTNRVSVYSNQALTAVIQQPVVADAHGRFGFWAPPGTYSYSAVNSSESLLGTYAFTLGGTGGGSATFPSTPGLVYGLSAATGRNATASDVIGLFSGCTGSTVLKADGSCGAAGTSINLTTTGTSGPATLTGGTLNVPQYDTSTSYFPGTSTVTVAGSPAIGQVLTATNSTHAAWATPSAGGGGGSGTVSGQTIGYVPLASSPTALTSSSVIEQTSTGLNIHATGNTHALTMLASSTPVTPLAGSAIIGSDATGNVVIADNGGTLSRPCTLANSVCGTFPSGAIVGTTDTQTLSNKTLVAPALGTPSAAVLTNATGLPLTSGTTGLLPVAKGGTGTATPGIVAGTNVTVTGTWPNQTVNSSASGGTTIAGPLQVPNLFSTVDSPSTASTFADQAQNVQNGLTAYFSDGTKYNCAGASYCGLGQFEVDQMLFCQGYESACDADLLRALLTHADTLYSTTQGFPVVIPQNLTTGTVGYCSAWDQYCLTGAGISSGDGRIMFPQALYMLCQKVGFGSTECTNDYNAYKAHIIAAWAMVPRNGTNHLFTVPTGPGTGANAEFVCGIGFQEYMRNTGAVANCNVGYTIVAADMKRIATASGDSTGAAYWETERANTVGGIRPNLIDGANGLLKAATGQNSANHDIATSALAVACDSSPVMEPCGVLTTAQKDAISNYFDTNYSSLVDANGYIKSIPEGGGWAYIGYIPNTGGPPYNASGWTATGYQGGDWTYEMGWFDQALGRVNPAKVKTHLNTFLNGVDPACEWFNQGASTCTGTTPNLESPAGAVLANSIYPLSPTYAAGAPCFNKYNAHTTGTGCASGLSGGTSTLTSTVTLDGNTATGNPLALSSSGTGGTGFQLLSSSVSSGYFDSHSILGSAFGAYKGRVCDIIGDNSGTPYYPQAVFCLGPTDSSHSILAFGKSTTLSWTNVNGDPNQPQDTAISHPLTGLLSIDTTGPNGLGEIALGSLQFNNTAGTWLQTTGTGGELRFVNNTLGGFTPFQLLGATSSIGVLRAGQNSFIQWVAANDVTASGAVVSGISNCSGLVCIDGGAAQAGTGTVKAGAYTGPATAPTGSCSGSVPSWVFSQDGHATFCDGTTWVSKI